MGARSGNYFCFGAGCGLTVSGRSGKRAALQNARSFSRQIAPRSIKCRFVERANKPLLDWTHCRRNEPPMIDISAAGSDLAMGDERTLIDPSRKLDWRRFPGESVFDQLADFQRIKAQFIYELQSFR